MFGRRRRSWFRNSRWMLVPALPVFAAGCGGHHRGHMDRMSEAEVQEAIKERAEGVLDWLDASKQQQVAINGMIDGVAPDLLKMRAERQQLATRLHAVLAADKIDRAELERVRKDAVALFDRASLRGADAVADAAEVLTPAQRLKVAQKWERFRR